MPHAPNALRIAVAAALVATPAQPAGLDHTHADFCAEAQRRLVGTRLPIQNVVETGFEPFKRSKPAVQPLRTHQFLERDAAGRAAQLSCKTKTADHLRSVHGAQAIARRGRAPVGEAGPADLACRQLHRDMVNEIWGSLTPEERARAAFPPTRVRLEPDAFSHTGSSWVRSRAAAWRAADDRLHLRSAALFAEWEDWRWKVMPESWRGNHYCHLVAPERLRRLMQGDEAPAAADPG